jgi:hypothetical protein
MDDPILYPDERIGEFLVRIGAMTEEKKQLVLEQQEQETDRLFGEIALELEFIDSTALDQYLETKGV